MVCLWIMTGAHTVPVSCQQSDCEGGQSLTTGRSDISPQTNNIFWPKPHDEYYSPHWTNWIPLSILPILHVWLKMYSCTWSVWSTSCGFSVDREMMTNYLHHWFMNKWKKNDFPLIHSAEELCESSCKQCVSDTSAPRKDKQSIMYYIHSINNQMICSVLWLHGYSAPSLAAVSLWVSLYTNTHLNLK